MYFLQLSAYSCTDGLNFFLGYVTHLLKMVLIVYHVFFLLARKTLLQNLLYLSFLNTSPIKWVPFQHISHLKGKSVSIDVSLNSLSNEKIFNNREIILAIIDTIKLRRRLGIALRGHRDASKYHPEIGHAPTLSNYPK